MMEASTKIKYQKYKNIVKTWEDEFMKENRKVPSKDDIRNASQIVRHAYKLYHTLKLQIINGSISVDKDETVDIEENNKSTISDEKIKNHIIPVFTTNTKELTSRLSALQRQLQSQENVKSPDLPGPNEGEHSNNNIDEVVPITTEKNSKKPGCDKKLLKKNSVRKFRERTSSFQLSEKLFNKSTQFKVKRNPLKPHLRRTKSECINLDSLSQDSGTYSQDSIDSTQYQAPESPDMFADEEEKEDYDNNLFPNHNFKVTLKDHTKIQSANVVKRLFNDETNKRFSLDSGWLLRCTSDKIESSPLISNKILLVKHVEIIPSENQNKSLGISDPICEVSVNSSQSQDNNNSANENKPEETISSSNIQCEDNSNSPIKTNIDRSSNMIIAESDENEILSGSDCESKIKQIKRPAEDTPAKHLKKKLKTKPSKLEALEKKVSSGRANENYVKINIQKKIFVRGKKNTSYSKYKKMMFKKRQNGSETTTPKGSCFTCGEKGHWSNNCPKADTLLPHDEAELIDDSPYLTLEEAGVLADENKPQTRFTPLSKDLAIEVENEIYTDGSEQSQNSLVRKQIIAPVYSRPDDNGYLIDTPLEVNVILRKFGYKSFRAGQEEAIMRILSGMSTLVMLSTGAGKSLCYQLPAYMYSQRNPGCITLVVSPLVSLMEDQVLNLPKPLVGACIHTNQTKKQREEIEEKMKEGLLHVLLVSPETVVQSENHGTLGGLLKNLPPIAFACIDEAHCVSQWSYNFRPAYLMLCKVLKEKLGIKTVVGLTATATRPTARSIAQHLNIEDGRVISDIPMPDNLVMSVSRDANKDMALIKLLQGPRFSVCDSIIIYCIRREECEKVSAMIRTCLKDSKKRESGKARALSWNAEAYHAGLTPHRRKQVQNAFMSGKLRIVVATVAFGMGINKNNLRAVIHYNMPSSFERFVQEVGRAGRDGLLAQCHLFLDSQGKDLSELRRHIYADSTERHVLRKLLLRVFKSCKCKNAVKNLEKWDPENEEESDKTREESPKKQVDCPGHEVAFLSQETVQILDLPEENILTLLCYLELHPSRFIEVLSTAYVDCKVISYAGAGALKAAARKCPPLAMAIALDHKNGISHEKSSSVDFKVIDVASAIGWDSGQVKRQLKDLEWRKEGDRFKRTNIVVKLSNPGIRVRAKGSLPPEDLDQALDWLMARVEQQEKSKLLQLEALFITLTKVSYPSCSDCLQTVQDEKCKELRTSVRTYFESEKTEDGELKLLPGVENEGLVRADVAQMFLTYSDTNFTGKAIARIFHGISSPCFPSHIWGRTRYWRLYLNDNFTALCKIASTELLKFK